jgi:hypothetical protein
MQSVRQGPPARDSGGLGLSQVWTWLSYYCPFFGSWLQRHALSQLENEVFREI